MNAMLAELHAVLEEYPAEHGSSGMLMLGPVSGEVTRIEGHATVLRGWWAYHGLQLVWEWWADWPSSWTNLIDRRVELPITHKKRDTRYASPATQAPSRLKRTDSAL